MLLVVVARYEVTGRRREVRLSDTLAPTRQEGKEGMRGMQVQI